MEKLIMASQGCAVVPDIMAALADLRRQLDGLTEALRDHADGIAALRAEFAQWRIDHTADCNELLRRLTEHELPHAMYHQAVAAVLDEHRAKRGDYVWRTLGPEVADPPG